MHQRVHAMAKRAQQMCGLGKSLNTLDSARALGRTDEPASIFVYITSTLARPWYPRRARALRTVLADAWDTAMLFWTTCRLRLQLAALASETLI